MAETESSESWQARSGGPVLCLTVVVVVDLI